MTVTPLPGTAASVPAPTPSSSVTVPLPAVSVDGGKTRSFAAPAKTSNACGTRMVGANEYETCPPAAAPGTAAATLPPSPSTTVVPPFVLTPARSCTSSASAPAAFSQPGPTGATPADTSSNDDAWLRAATTVTTAPSTLTDPIPPRLAPRNACAARAATPAASSPVKSMRETTETALGRRRLRDRSSSPVKPCGAPKASVQTVGR